MRRAAVAEAEGPGEDLALERRAGLVREEAEGWRVVARGTRGAAKVPVEEERDRQGVVDREVVRSRCRVGAVGVEGSHTERVIAAGERAEALARAARGVARRALVDRALELRRRVRVVAGRCARVGGLEPEGWLRTRDRVGPGDDLGVGRRDRELRYPVVLVGDVDVARVVGGEPDRTFELAETGPPLPPVGDPRSVEQELLDLVPVGVGDVDEAVAVDLDALGVDQPAPGGEGRAGRVEFHDPAVVGIGDVDVADEVRGDARGTAHLAGVESAPAPPGDEGPDRVVLPDHAEAPVEDVDAAVGGDVHGMGELRAAADLDLPLGEKGPVGGELLDPAVLGVGDVEVAGGVGGNVLRLVEIAIAPADAAGRDEDPAGSPCPIAAPGPEPVADRVELLDPVVGGIGDVEEIGGAGGVDGEAPGIEELTVGRARTRPGRIDLVVGISGARQYQRSKKEPHYRGNAGYPHPPLPGRTGPA